VQKYVLAIAAGLASMAVGAAIVVLERHVVSRPSPSTIVAIPLPAPIETPPPSEQTASAAPEAAPEAVSPATAENDNSDLPVIDVPSRVVRTVPDIDTPAPKMTVFDTRGNEIRGRAAEGPPASYVPSPAFSSGPAYASNGRPQTRAQTPVTAPSAGNFGGPGRALGGTVVSVGNRNVHLFGVRVAEPRDRCGLGPGDHRSCADVARDSLAQRMQRYPTLACRVPPGQRGDPGVVCTDNSGTDLSNFLVSEGLALADTGQSYEYFGSEGIARANKRGLWRNR
jgi:endonuclease YncB( thermonuclease family)